MPHLGPLLPSIPWPRRARYPAGGRRPAGVRGAALLVGSALIGACNGASTVAGGTATTRAPTIQTTAPPPTTCPAADGSTKRRTSFDQPPPTCIDPALAYRAVVTTTKGAFTIDLDSAAAPIAVNNFVVLARYHFYDGSPFDRIVSDYVVQSGKPAGEQAEGPGYAFVDELPADRSAYTPGVVAMTSTAANRNGSEFLVVVANQGLALRYSIFGRVTEGLTTTIAAINAVGSPTGTPSAVVTITNVAITEAPR